MSDLQLLALYLGIVVVYFIEHAIDLAGIRRAITEVPRSDDEVDSGVDGAAPPHCTVLVCARDEEGNIARCLASLDGLDYPKDRVEILVVNDHSTDHTAEILHTWQARMPNLRVIEATDPVGELQGKVNALAQGMDAARGEFVMITDADSVVPPRWLREYLRNYRATTGMVASLTLLRARGVFTAIQSLDWAYGLGVTMAMANLGVPLSVIGNNLSLRREAYEAIGGYRGIPFSITEDFALFQHMWHSPPWTVRCTCHRDLTVESIAAPNLRAWWRQKQRWVNGGRSVKGIAYLIAGLTLIGNLAMMSAPFVLSISGAAIVIGVKLLADLLVVLPILFRTRRLLLLLAFLPYEVYQTFYMLCIPIMLTQKNVTWKGRVYHA